jgi:hypothetical protein
METARTGDGVNEIAAWKLPFGTVAQIAADMQVDNSELASI